MPSLLLVGVLFAAAVGATEPIHIGPEKCAQGQLRAPAGPFAVQLFCEDALATHIGVIYLGRMGAPLDGGWSITDRFWQQGIWAADVQDVAWSADSAALFVATAGVYGSGGLYQLDLHARKAYGLVLPSRRMIVRIRRVTERWVEYTALDTESKVTPTPRRAAVRRMR